MPIMPNVIGVEVADALAAMVTAGVRVIPLGYFQTDPVAITWVKSATGKAGFVIAQFPDAGTSMAPNSVVLLNAAAPPVSIANYGGIGS